MRKLVQVEDAAVGSRLCSYLNAKQVSSHLDDEKSEDGYQVWVLDDEVLEKAKSITQEFFANPTAREVDQAIKAWHEKTVAQSQKKTRHKEVNARTEIFSSGFSASSPVSFGLIVVCVCFFLLQFFDPSRVLRSYFWISKYVAKSLPEVFEQGQLWRLFTPCLLHKDIFHLIFNMYWLYLLGSSLEKNIKRSFYILLVVSIGIGSNLAHYYLLHPAFEGMSGVIYGLGGYMWSSGVYNSNSKVSLDESTKKFFAFWYVLCWVLTAFGFRVANTIHGVGAFIGIALGIVEAFFFQAQMKRRLTFTKEDYYNFVILIVMVIGGMITDVLFHSH